MNELTPHELRILKAYATHGSEASAAEHLHVRVQTVKNAKSMAYDKLDAHNAIEAFKKMGWLIIPE